MYLVLSASLHPESRSRLLAESCHERLRSLGEDCQWYDLAAEPLPACDGSSAYGAANVGRLGELIEQADAIFLAAPVYNYDVNAAAKNAVELTGQKWTGKVVGLMLAAGGQGSYMSGMGLANSLMLDFRCVIVPRFIYATGESFEGARLADEEVRRRIDLLVEETTRLAVAVKQTAGQRQADG